MPSFSSKAGEHDAAGAARLRIGIGDRLGLEQRLLERLRRGNVRHGCALAHRHAGDGAAEIDDAAGHEQAGLVERGDDRLPTG